MRVRIHNAIKMLSASYQSQLKIPRVLSRLNGVLVRLTGVLFRLIMANFAGPCKPAVPTNHKLHNLLTAS